MADRELWRHGKVVLLHMRSLEVTTVGQTFCASALALAAIYVLSPGHAGSHAPVVTPLVRRATLPHLMRNA